MSAPLAGRELIAATCLYARHKRACMFLHTTPIASMEECWAKAIRERQESALMEADALIALLTGDEAVERAARRRYEASVSGCKLPFWEELTDKHKQPWLEGSRLNIAKALGIEGEQ